MSPTKGHNLFRCSCAITASFRCQCTACRCPRTVIERSTACRQCRANLHDGRPSTPHRY